MSVLQTMPLLRPVRTKADWERLTAEAAEDNHQVFFPSHLIEKGGEVAGYMGLCSMPLLRFWLHSERMKARDTVTVLNLAENMMRANGIEVAAGLISKESPAFPLVRKFGWSVVGESMVCMKNLKE